MPAAILGLIFAAAGNGTWLSFFLGMVGLVFVGININQFARRSASPGSLYTYIVKGLGPTVGVLSGWALLFGYMLTGMSALCGFAIFGQMLLGQIGFHLPVLVLFAVGVIVSCGVAYRDIQLSAKKDPLRTIPKSLIQSTVLSGVFSVFMAYTIILGFHDTGLNLRKTEAPLDVLASRGGLGFLGTLINVGAFLSFFSCTLACINSTARIVSSMARHGLLHDVLGEAHETNETPHIAVGVSALVTFLVPATAYLLGIHEFDAQGYFGTLSSLGFLLVYILVSIAAPLYLRGMSNLRGIDVLYSGLGVGFMILPLLGTIGIPGSTLFPVPAFPNNLLLWLFVTYMMAGLGWLLLQKIRSPRMIHEMKLSIDEIHLKFGDVKNVS